MKNSKSAKSTEVQLETLSAEIAELAKNPAVYTSSCEENLTDRGIQMPDIMADADTLLAYARELRAEILSSYGV